MNAVWVIRQLDLPAIVRTCVSCGTARHHPSGKFRVNANGKLLDVWMLVHCDRCGSTSKIPIHERVQVGTLESARRMMFEDNDPAAVRELAMSASLAARRGYRLDWTGTWELDAVMPERTRGDRIPLEVAVRFELPAPIRVEKLLMAGLGVSRSRARRLVASGHIVLPVRIDAAVHADFTLTISSLSGLSGPAGGRPAEREGFDPVDAFDPAEFRLSGQG